MPAVFMGIRPLSLRKWYRRDPLLCKLVDPIQKQRDISISARLLYLRYHTDLCLPIARFIRRVI